MRKQDKHLPTNLLTLFQRLSAMVVLLRVVEIFAPTALFKKNIPLHEYYT